MARISGRSFLAAFLVFAGLLSATVLSPVTGINLVPIQSALAAPCPQPLGLVNGSFETPEIPDGATGPAGWTWQRNNYGIWYVPQDDVPGWSQTAPSHIIEMWENPTNVANGSDFGPRAYDGDTYVELNYDSPGTIYQDLDTSTLQGLTLTWGFAHRGRDGVDTMALGIGPVDGDANFTQQFSTGNDAWSYYSGTYTVPVGQTTTRFAYSAISTSTGNPANGNFLDDITFGTPPCSADLAVTKTSDPDAFAPGAPITYTLHVTNDNPIDGQFDIVGGQLTDTVPADVENVTWTCTASSGSACGNASGSGNNINETYDLLEGGSIDYVVTGTVSATTTATELVNTATVAAPSMSGQTPLSDPNLANNTSTVHTPLGEPGITIDKISDYTDPLTVGDTVPYRFVVTNTGTVDLTDVTVSDPLQGLTTISPASVASLEPGDSTTFTASYVIKQADVDAGQVSNTATVTGTAPGTLGTATGTDTEVVEGDPTPKLTITKTSDVEPGAAIAVGDVITYTITAKNDGNVTLNNIVPSDSLAGISAISPASYPSLAPGESTDFTATYTVTQADVDAGEIVNSASGTADAPATCTSCPPVPPADPASVTVDIPQTPALEITKSGDPTGDVAEGDTVTYTFDVTNTGNVTLSDVTVADALPGLTWVTGPNVGDLAPGDSAEASATYIVQRADIDSGTVHNTASVSGTPPDGCDCTAPTAEDTLDVSTVGTPGLSLEKMSDVAAGETVGVGDTVTYTFTLTNTGNVPIDDATITDTMPGLSWVTGPDVGTIAPGDSATGSATYVVTQADVDHGSIDNSATADGDCGDGCDVPMASADASVATDPAAPGLEVDKTSDATGTVALGDTITFTFTATNTGNVTLSDVSISDELAGLSDVSPAAVTSLAPGASTTFTATYVVTANDVAVGFVHNDATASGTPPESCVDCPATTGEDDLTIPTTGEAGILISKGADADSNVTLNQTITYTFDVYNTGDVNLVDIQVNDPLPGLSAIDCPATTLVVRTSMECTATYVVTQDDIDRGRIDNTASISASPADGGDAVTDTDDKNIPTEPQVPGIQLDQSSDSAGGVAVGDTITFTYVVTNTGNITLSGATVSDPLPGLTWVTGPTVGELAPGESATLTATYVVTQADVDSGLVDSPASVQGDVPGTCVNCPSPTDNDDTTVTTEAPAPALSLEKVADTEGPVAIGDTVTFTLTAENTGNITINDVTLDDELAGLTWVTGPDLGTLAPGESASGTATYVVTASDIAAGGVDNTATVDGDTPASCADCPAIEPPTAEVVVPGEAPAPALSIEKSVDSEGPVALGQTLTYTFTVTNTGNVNVENATVSDDLAGLTWVTGPNLGTLAPGESATGTATYVVTESDIVAGEVDNVATAGGDPDPICADCPAITPPSDEIDVSTDPAASGLAFHMLFAPAGPVALGDTITYTYTVTNTGNVSIDGVTVSDDLPGLTWVDDPELGTLAPGQTVTLTATYVVTADDIQAGVISNAASVDGDTSVTCPSCGDLEPATDSAEVPTVDAAAAVDFTMVPDTAGPLHAGDVITYTYTATNSGNVVLDGLSIGDDLPGLTWISGPDLGSLAPGEVATGTATYVVTQADVNAGFVSNTATLEATPECDGCELATPDPVTVAVPTASESGILLDKSSDTAGPVAAGDVITYTYTVTNTGAVDLSDITIDDPLVGTIFCANSIAPGESVTCTATYTVTADDVAAGQVSGEATVTGLTAGGDSVSASDNDTVATANPCNTVNLPLDQQTFSIGVLALQALPTDTVEATATDVPTEAPTDTATVAPTDAPTDTPTLAPTDTSTVAPTVADTATTEPTDTPTVEPTAAATETATTAPTDTPTAVTTTTADTPTVEATATDPSDSTPQSTATAPSDSSPQATATDPATATASPTATQRPGTPSAGCSSPTPTQNDPTSTPTPMPTPTTPSNPSGPSAPNGGGNGGGGVAIVTDLPNTGDGAALNGTASSGAALALGTLISFLLLGFFVLLRRSERRRAGR